MRIAFMGTPEFAVRSLEALISSGFTPVVVVTGADKPRGRGRTLSPTPVKESALRHNIPFLQPLKLSDPEFVDQLRALSLDLIVVVAFRILPENVFLLPTRGAFNLHASLLPRYRGAAPINWAIINGDRETGVTTFFLEKKVDTGRMIMQEKITIEDEDDAGALHDKLAELGANVVVRTVEVIASGAVTPVLQDDVHATPAPKIFPEHCKIDWTQPALRVRDFVRGMAPVPGAWTIFRGKVLKVYRTRLTTERATGAAGTLQLRNGRLLTGGSDVLLEILELQLEGRKRMGIEEFLRGHRVSDGERLGA
jgi:methionyl-tRNA formyltransferase